MAGYSKLFGSILDSTVWKLPATYRCVWFTLMAMRDKDGVVSASVPGLADRAKIPLPIVEKALAVFLAPDPYSRTPDKEGRRIEKVDGGWRLVNHWKYREMDGKGDGDAEVHGRVYFVRSGDRIKIAFSRNPWARVAAMKAASQFEPELLGHFHGTARDARDTVERFRNLELPPDSGWFEVTPELLAFIATKSPVVATSTTGSYGSQLPHGSVSVAEHVSDPPKSGDPDPAGARSNSDASKPLTGHALCRLFGQVRSRETDGLPWQGARDANGKASSMADDLNEDPAARADVEATMVLLFRNAKAGKAGDRSADILKQPAFAFGAWCSQFTALREELAGKTPIVPLPTRTERDIRHGSVPAPLPEDPPFRKGAQKL